MSQFIEMFGHVTDDSPCLNDVAGVYDGTHKTPTYTDYGIPFISVENINNIYCTNKYISKVDYELYKYKPEYGDVFMTRIGTIGKCAVYESSEPLAYYVSLSLIKPNRNVIHPKFLKYYIESNDGIRELRKRALLKAFPMKINLGEIGKIKIILPSLESQSSFVRIAEHADKSEFGGSKSQFIEMFGDKKNGSVLTVGEISSMLFAGGDKPKDISLCKTEDYKYPVWANGIGDNGLMGFSRTYQVDKKSLTISARGTIGYCSIREPYYTPVVRLIVIIPNEKIELTYLKFFFENTGFEKTGAVQGQLTIPVLKEKKVYVPSVVLQKKFVSIVQQADKSEKCCEFRLAS